MARRQKAIYYFISIILLLPLYSCTKRIAPEESHEKKTNFALVIHGGAGAMKPGSYTPEQEMEYKAKLTQALKIGYKILNNGGSSLDAVEKVINTLEDSPLFNAGKGAVFTSNGINELDASIMDGKTMNAGAVAEVRHVKNPISLARKVMTNSPHVLLAGEGAEQFAKEQGFTLVDENYFYTKKRWDSLQKIKARERQKSNKSKKQTSNVILNGEHKFGTVGCVALDKNGDLAAGTSTGGMTNKKFGRIGDSPIIGAGTYADNNTCAVSCTGHGEYFIRYDVAYDITALMKYKKKTVKEAADEVILNKLVKRGGSGGVIAIDKYGNMAMPFNTSGMFRGFITDKGVATVKIYKE